MRLLRYFRDSIGEARNIKWLSLNESFKLLVLVLIVGIVAGLFLGGIDRVMSILINIIP